jgi:hypothetical protein
MSDSDKRPDSGRGERPPEGGALIGNKDFIKRVRAMSSSERVSFMVSAGINEPNGKLTDRYRD